MDPAYFEPVEQLFHVPVGGSGIEILFAPRENSTLEGFYGEYEGKRTGIDVVVSAEVGAMILFQDLPLGLLPRIPIRETTVTPAVAMYVTVRSSLARTVDVSILALFKHKEREPYLTAPVPPDRRRPL